MSYSSANANFRIFFNSNFPDFIVVNTNGPVSLLLADYAFIIPELHIYFTNNLPSSSFYFTDECYIKIETLTLILNLAPSNCLISSDSVSCFQALNFNPFNFHLSPLVLRIKSLVITLNQFNSFRLLIILKSTTMRLAII